MDIRDFKSVEVPEIHSNGMFKIYELQRELIDHYVKIEKNPNYPVDLDVKKNQSMLKDFIARVVEELGEGFESIVELRSVIHHRNAISEDFQKETEYRVIRVQNFNEELSDALHFFVETLIYSGVSEEDVNKHIRSWLPNGFEYTNVSIIDTLELTLWLGYFLNEAEGISPLSPQHYHILPEPYYGLAYLKAGRVLDKDSENIIAKLMWGITYKLQLARNQLKNKPWKQTEMLTDHRMFKKHLMDSWVEMGCLFSYLGMESTDIFEIYYRKNQVNQFRIKSKY